MHILKYDYHGPENEAWEFSTPSLRKINLIVGDTGTGKTRFLNTIFNFGKSVVAKEIGARGIWNILFNTGKR
ncbi:MAG: CpaF/VirB11 family protein, partial [Candidatus Atribacteria bacterium]|nr:CpaF/VirB11 family protein [Candidatus Atribacteria bacterium]